MSISVVIPTINRYDDLKNTIGDLLKQSLQEFEVIIVDQSKSGEHSTEFDFDPRLKYIHRPDFSSASRARNLGLLESRFPIVLFLDDDVIIEDPCYLENMVKAMRSGYNGATGPILDYPRAESRRDRSRWSYNKNWGWLFFPRNYSRETEINDAGAGNLCVKRDWAIKVGGMDEQFEKGAYREESDFNLRYTRQAGPYKFSPDCSIVHIGSRVGGIRSWNQNQEIKAQHHFTGFWYFILKNVRWYALGPHLIVSYLYFFKKKAFLKRPHWLLQAVFRYIKGFFLALGKKMEGPKYIGQ